MTITLDRDTQASDQAPASIRLALELTWRCQLECAHCFTNSSPTAPESTMTLADWIRVLDQAPALGVGIVQLIGGEPLVSPHCAPLLEYALGLGLRVEVFTNLYTVTPRMWELLARPGVSIATSVYSDLAIGHDSVTGKAGSFTRNRANLSKALELGIPVRAGVVAVFETQRARQARAELLSLGVTNTKVKRMRQIGRPNSANEASDSELCGRCGHGQAAILADGTLAPCVMGRHLRAGNVTDTPLVDILAGEAWNAALARVPLPGPDGEAGCSPDDPCPPTDSAPDTCGPDICSPADE